jgi:hypothetical protein
MIKIANFFDLSKLSLIERAEALEGIARRGSDDMDPDPQVMPLRIAPQFAFLAGQVIDQLLEEAKHWDYEAVTELRILYAVWHELTESPHLLAWVSPEKREQIREFLVTTSPYDEEHEKFIRDYTGRGEG